MWIAKKDVFYNLNKFEFVEMHEGNGDKWSVEIKNLSKDLPICLKCDVTKEEAEETFEEIYKALEHGRTGVLRYE